MLATDVMRTWFATVKPNAPLLDAVRLLLETNQRGLPVIDDNGSFVGTLEDLAPVPYAERKNGVCNTLAWFYANPFAISR